MINVLERRGRVRRSSAHRKSFSYVKEQDGKTFSLFPRLSTNIPGKKPLASLGSGRRERYSCGNCCNSSSRSERQFIDWMNSICYTIFLFLFPQPSAKSFSLSSVRLLRIESNRYFSLCHVCFVCVCMNLISHLAFTFIANLNCTDGPSEWVSPLSLWQQFTSNISVLGVSHCLRQGWGARKLIRFNWF